MFDLISFSTYGRTIKSNNWTFQHIQYTNRIWYIHSGSVTYSSGNIRHTLTAGNFYILPQNLAFKLDIDHSTCVDHTFFDFILQPALLMDDIVSFKLSDYPVIEAAAKALFTLVEAHPMYLTTEQNQYYGTVKKFFLGVLELVNAEIPLGFITDHLINHSLYIIHNNFHTSTLSVADIAAKLHIETSYFIKRFKRYMNITPYQYLKNYRLDKALSLIESRNYTISQIAEIVGFSDVSSLSHAIKKNFGVSPQEILTNSHKSLF